MGLVINSPAWRRCFNFIMTRAIFFNCCVFSTCYKQPPGRPFSSAGWRLTNQTLLSDIKILIYEALWALLLVFVLSERISVSRPVTAQPIKLAWVIAIRASLLASCAGKTSARHFKAAENLCSRLSITDNTKSRWGSLESLFLSRANSGKKYCCINRNCHYHIPLTSGMITRASSPGGAAEDV